MLLNTIMMPVNNRGMQLAYDVNVVRNNVYSAVEKYAVERGSGPVWGCAEE
ncbi:MAG: hypothetical protein U5R06_10715 [candidate division KSB1 bacterium]|nr:hypothetical protein [candidate division KSB1 bacterium]